MKAKLNLTGKIVGHLLVEGKQKTATRATFWHCHCNNCGNKCVVSSSHLASFYDKSCGCALPRSKPQYYYENDERTLSAKEWAKELSITIVGVYTKAKREGWLRYKLVGEEFVMCEDNYDDLLLN